MKRAPIFRMVSFVIFLATGAQALAAGAPPAHPTRLPFVEDDYSGALRQARARGVPIFVETWAPW